MAKVLRNVDRCCMRRSSRFDLGFAGSLGLRLVEERVAMPFA
jgi:hypothetical protein